MKPALKKTFTALLIAFVSLVIVIGIASLSMVQGGSRLLPANKDTATPTMETLQPETIDTPAVIPTKESSSSIPESSPACKTPQEWMPVIVNADQSLKELATLYNTSADMLQQGNCLKEAAVKAGTILFIPVTGGTVQPTQQSQSSAPCGPPVGWVIYYVQAGDTLYGIASSVGISVNQLMTANCLKGSNIYVGQKLYVPYLPPYYGNPIQPLPLYTPTFPGCGTIADCLTPEVPYLPTGIPFPPP